MFSFIGLPPLIGFFGKLMVLTTALSNNFDILVITAILTSVVGAVYYLSIIKRIFFDVSEYERSYIFIDISLATYLSVTLTIFMLIISCFVLIPDFIIHLCELLASITFSEIVEYN
jgi:NADH-ubiquinone oxidoreductase chain 2